MAKVTFTIHKAGKHQRHSRRNQILDAAQRCFKKQGFHKTTLRDIAQEFGMSAGHIYNYFSNKEAIIEALVELRTQEFLDMIDTDKFADLPPEERMDKELGQVVDAYLNLDNTSLSIAIMNEALINPKVYEIVVAAASKVRNHIVEAQLLAMKEERRYAPPYEVIESRCMTIRAMLEGLRLAHIFTPEMDVPLVREMAIKRIKQIIALDEAEDQAAAAAADSQAVSRKGLAARSESTMRTAASPVRKSTPERNDRPISAQAFSPFFLLMCACTPKPYPMPNIMSMRKKTPASAAAPSSTSPTRPRKATSVMPMSCSSRKLSISGTAMRKMVPLE